MTTHPLLGFACALLLVGSAAAVEEESARVDAMKELEGTWRLASAGDAATSCSIELTREWVDPKLPAFAKVSAEDACGKVDALFGPTEDLSWMVRDPAKGGFEIQARPKGSDAAPDVVGFTAGKEEGTYAGEYPRVEGKPLQFTLTRANP